MSWFVSAFATPEVLSELPNAETTHTDHGRVERRRAFVSQDLGWMKGPKTSSSKPIQLPGLVTLGMIEATVTRNGKTTTTHHYHLSSRSQRRGLFGCRQIALVDRKWSSLGTRHGV